MANRSFNNQVFTDDNMVAPGEKPGKLSANPECGDDHHRLGLQVLTVGEQKRNGKGYTSDQFFGLFTARFIQGNAATFRMRNPSQFQNQPPVPFRTTDDGQSDQGRQKPMPGSRRGSDMPEIRRFSLTMSTGSTSTMAL